MAVSVKEKYEFYKALEAWCKENGISWIRREESLDHIFSKGKPGSTEFEIERCFGEGSPCVGFSQWYLDTISETLSSKEKFVKFMSLAILREFELSKCPRHINVYGI